MSQQPSDTLVDKNNHKEKNNIPKQQKLFYPCVYTTQYANESPASGTLIDEKLKSFDADFIRLGDELRRERKMKVLQRYIQYSSEDKKRLNLLQRFTIVSKLRGMPRLPKKRTDVETLVMSKDPHNGDA
ncbi:hypothetical protein COH20_002744 [Aspergillus flavus]|nr:hypothetical protein COH21_000502 [Aspergillus flavus]RAQ66211.1 hypothetical protein COH20_002744 [Aspergillus flavus]